MALPKIHELREFVEQQQASLTDPAERDRVLETIEHEMTGVLAAVRTYRGDAQMQMRGSSDSSPA